MDAAKLEINQSKESLSSLNLCPYCSGDDKKLWASELKYNLVRCTECSLLYVYPMPTHDEIEEAVKTGIHRKLGLNVTSRRIPNKKKRYIHYFRRLFPDILEREHPVTWVDIGCGYGEVLEAVTEIAPAKSRVVGYEPMEHKALAGKSLGLDIINEYLKPGVIKADVISVVDVFSHIPDFSNFLKIVSTNLSETGLLFIETGNLADLKSREQFSGELGLPDHLVFAGEITLRGYLQKAGFDIESTYYQRTDTIFDFTKNIVKRLLGRSVRLAIPYTSNYRQILIRARLKPKS